MTFFIHGSNTVDFSGTRPESSNSSSSCCVLTPNIAKRALRHRARSFVRSHSCFSSIPSSPPALSLFSFFLARPRFPAVGLLSLSALSSFFSISAARSPRGLNPAPPPPSWHVSKTPRNFLIKRNIVWKGLIYSTREATFMVGAATTSYGFLRISPNKYPRVSSPLPAC